MSAIPRRIPGSEAARSFVQIAIVTVLRAEAHGRPCPGDPVTDGEAEALP